MRRVLLLVVTSAAASAAAQPLDLPDDERGWRDVLVRDDVRVLRETFLFAGLDFDDGGGAAQTWWAWAEEQGGAGGPFDRVVRTDVYDCVGRVRAPLQVVRFLDGVEVADERWGGAAGPPEPWGDGTAVAAVGEALCAPPPPDLPDREVYDAAELAGAPAGWGAREPTPIGRPVGEPIRVPPPGGSGAEGAVVVGVVVDEVGRVVEAAVVESPNALLNEAALEAARGARFAPGSVRGRPVRVRTVLHVEVRGE